MNNKRKMKKKKKKMKGRKAIQILPRCWYKREREDIRKG
jgi:hypothetical protein